MLWAVASFAQQGVVAEINVSGNRRVTTERILLQMRTRVGQPFSQAQLDQDRAAIMQLGWFAAVDVRAIPGETDNWRVNVEVAEFEVVKEIRIVGNTVIPTETIREALAIEVGQPFNLNWQRPSDEAVRKLYSDRGYVGLIDQIEPLEESPGTVSVVIREMEIRSVTWQGNTKTQDYIMRRLIRSRPGQPYNVRTWDEDLRRVWTTQWFDRVVPVERLTEDGFGVDLVVDVREARTGQFLLGATLEPRSGLAGQLRIADTNFRGTGQTIGASYFQTIAGGGASVDLEYLHPFIDRHDTALSLNLYSRVLHRFHGVGFGTGPSFEDRFTERRTGGAVGLQRPIGANTFANVGMRYETIRTSELPTTAAQAGFIQQDGDLGLLSFGLTRDTRDFPLDPARGNWANLTVEPGFSNITRVGGAIQDPTLLGRSNFLRNTLEYRHYFSPQPPRGRQLDDPRRVFAFRARYGTISGRVPFAEQFFVGGSTTLRGYPDDRFWGRQTLITTLEYRHPIQRAFSAIAFVDYGGAWGGFGGVNEFTQSERVNLHLGYGLGVSFRSPFGPIRLDFAWNERGGTRTHFLIGTSF
jgi:outer membrane protein insertion porin family